MGDFPLRGPGPKTKTKMLTASAGAGKAGGYQEGGLRWVTKERVRLTHRRKGMFFLPFILLLGEETKNVVACKGITRSELER